MAKAMAGRGGVVRARPWALLFVLLFGGGCVTPESWEATRVLRDIEAGPGPSRLKDTTPAPRREEIRYEIDGRAMVADLYHPNQPVGAALLFLPGFTPDGKDDVRVVTLARTLSRARFLVMVPDLEGTRALQVRPEDARAIADAVVHLSERTGAEVGVLALSYAVGLAVTASDMADARPGFGFLLSIGGYYDTEAVVTFSTTGRYRDPDSGEWRTRAPQPFAKWIFLASNLGVIEDEDDRATLEEIVARRLRDPEAPVDDLVGGLGAEARTLYDLVANTDPDRVADLLARLPEPVRAQIGELTLAGRNLSHLAGRAILIHGREDDMIPFGESMRLAEAIPDADLHLIDGFSHIDPAGVPLIGQLQLICATAAVLRRRTAPTPEG